MEVVYVFQKQKNLWNSWKSSKGIESMKDAKHCENVVKTNREKMGPQKGCLIMDK